MRQGLPGILMLVGATGRMGGTLGPPHRVGRMILLVSDTLTDPASQTYTKVQRVGEVSDQQVRTP